MTFPKGPNSKGPDAADDESAGEGGSPPLPGGVIHTYQKYDPQKFPSPTQPPPDLASAAFEHMLAFGDDRELTPEQLANAVKLDPSQIAGLGPSLDALRKMLEERKRKILERYETDLVVKEARVRFKGAVPKVEPPPKLRKRFEQAVKQEQLRELERMWYEIGDDRAPFARQLMPLVGKLAEKFEIDELAGKYEFTGNERLTIPKALEIKEELETIDRLLKQLEEAAKSAQVGLIDLEELSQFADQAQMDDLARLQQQVQEYLRDLAERQGLDQSNGRIELSPQAYRLFQGKLLNEIFSALEAARSGRHQGPIEGEGAVELSQTKGYEFGDSIANLDLTATFINSLLRQGDERPLRLHGDDMVVHRTRNNPKCATAVLMDMSGSMRYGGQYVNVKRMALALQGLIQREFPGDFLQFIEMFTFAKLCAAGDLVKLLPKMVTLFDPVVRLRADMSDPAISEAIIPPHFTNIQHALRLARTFLSVQDTPNRQIILITDGLPTAHFEGNDLYLLYPPDPRTEEATLREGLLCKQAGILINLFVLPSWSQSSEDVRFCHKLAESTGGRAFFTGGKDLDRYVVWDYVKRVKKIIT